MIIFSSSGETSFSTCRSGDVSTGGAVTDALYIGLRRLPGFSSNVAGRFRPFPVLVVPAGAWLVAGTYWALLSSYKDSMLLLLILFRIFSPIGLVGACVYASICGTPTHSHRVTLVCFCPSRSTPQASSHQHTAGFAVELGGKNPRSVIVLKAAQPILYLFIKVCFAFCSLRSLGSFYGCLLLRLDVHLFFFFLVAD